MANAAPGLVDRLAARPYWRLLSGFLLGLFAALGQAPVDLSLATLVGVAGGFALLMTASTTRGAALTGWAFGTGYFGLTFIWIIQPFLVEPEVYGWMAPFALALMAGGMALFWGAGFAAARALCPDGGGLWLAFGVTMGATELGRATLFTGLPWGGPGLAWIDTPVAQIASFIGAFGLAVLTFALAGVTAQAIARSRWRAAPGLLAMAGVIAGVGDWLGHEPPPAHAEPVTLRLVQPNAPQHLKWDPDHVWEYFDGARALSMEPAEGRAPDVVIWPETTIPTLMGRNPEVEMAAVASAAPAALVAGIRRLDGSRGYNTLVVYGADASVQSTYDKHHIVPFGEYVPFGDLLGRLGINGMAARDGYGYSSGPGAAVLDLPGPLGKALPLICYEAIFPRDLRSAPGRADWILQITNDAWFGTFSGPQQHLVQARFRAIEMGLPFVRAANTGISAVIDARGKVVAALPLGTTGKLDALLPGALPSTVFARFGDMPVVLALMLAFAGLLVLRRAKAVDPGESAL